jgi:hypothetical protein
MHCKTQTRPHVREGALHEEGSTYQTREHVESGHGRQRAGRHQDVLADGTVGPKFNSTLLLHVITIHASRTGT